MTQKVIYEQRIEQISKDTEKDFILPTGDFQCPDSGWGCIINWDTTKGMMWAEVCETGIWEVRDDHQIDEDTYRWCNMFSTRPASNAEEANEVLTAWLGDDADLCCYSED